MAKRRMFAISLMESDGFLDLSPMTQLLYVHLNLHADDDGVVDKVKTVMRAIGATSKQYKALIDEGYIMELNKKAILITHWNQHNRIKSDRYTPTLHTELMSGISKDKNDRYIKVKEDFCGDISAPQDSIGKVSTDKESSGEESTVEESIVEERVAEVSVIEEKEKEFSHSLIHTNSPSESGENNSKISTSSCDVTFTQSLKNAIALYFMKRYKTTNILGFVEYCQKNEWIGDGGESMADNYQKYADRYMKKQA